jgi:hypothetical protein
LSIALSKFKQREVYPLVSASLTPLGDEKQPWRKQKKMGTKIPGFYLTPFFSNTAYLLNVSTARKLRAFANSSRFEQHADWDWSVFDIISKTTDFGLGLNMRSTFSLVYNTGGCRHVHKSVHPGQQSVASKGGACDELDAIEALSATMKRAPANNNASVLGIAVNLALVFALQDDLLRTTRDLGQVFATVSRYAVKLPSFAVDAPTRACKKISIGALTRDWGRQAWMLGHWDEYHQSYPTSENTTLLPLVMCTPTII